ncbi:MAG: sulfatase-like hydrolase/transferase [Verrucomicrobiota bacterium]
MKSTFLLATLASALFSLVASAESTPRPNIILVMTDDQGWGQVGYYDHPVLETPNLDAMAANGLRFDRFYAGASNCSPTRATVLTGRSNDRCGVFDHGYPLRLQEKTIAQALRDEGYSTGHFGKWHLNGLRGPGAPILADDTHHPGAFGFDTWLSATNYFDMDPLLSRGGKIEDHDGDSSEVAIAEALKFIEEQSKSDDPFFVVVWFGTPHDPMIASEEDRAPFADLPEHSQHQHGELVAMDRSIGALRQGLRDLDIANNTLFWFNSDNGGLSKIEPDSVGGLRGSKNTMFEGGLRVPCVVEWPAVIKPRVTEFPAGTIDIFPTLADVAGLPNSAAPHDLDGISLKPLFTEDLKERAKPLPFRHRDRGVIIDNQFKFISQDGTEELYDLVADPAETTDLSAQHPEVLARLKLNYETFNASVENSVAGKDYPSGTVDPQPERRFWTEDKAYEPYFDDWKDRPEYKSRLNPSKKSKSKSS